MWTSRASDAFLEPEITVQISLGERLVDAYLRWNDHFRVGESEFTLYRDIVDFINFRVETSQTVTRLATSGSVANALALCRGLLEDTLLLRLMVRGFRFFVTRDCSHMRPEEFAEFLAEEQATFTRLCEAETQGTLIDVCRHRKRQAVMYVREGVSASDDPELRIPLHYFQFREFRPEAMRLRPEDYFQYLPLDEDLGRALKKHRSDATQAHAHYLSYSALVECLLLNGLADEDMVKRLEAHYTFLGRFVHPTHEAARELHHEANAYSGRPFPGLASGYAATSRLLSLVYANFLLAHALEEFCLLLDAAPPKYVADAGTDDIRRVLREVWETRYFWFLENEASDYDKYNWAVNHMSAEEIQTCGGYLRVPSSAVAFNESIYANFCQALLSWGNGKAGRYVPPIAAG